VNLLFRLVNFFFGVVGLALLLQVILPWLNVSPRNPWLRRLEQATEPLVRPVRRVMQGGIRSMGGRYVDIAPLATLFVLWLVRLIVLQVLYLIAAPPLWLFDPFGNLARWVGGIVNLLFQVYLLILMLRLLLEWLGVSYINPVMRFLWRATEPLLGPVRRRMPLVGPLDFSPLVLFFALLLLNMLLQTIIYAVL